MSDMMPSRWKLAPARSLEVIAYTAADLEYMTGIHKGTWDQWRYERQGPKWLKIGSKVLYLADGFRRWWSKQLEENGVRNATATKGHRMARARGHRARHGW